MTHTAGVKGKMIAVRLYWSRWRNPTQERRTMEREGREESLTPYFVKGPLNIVTLGRWAGVFVLLSAVALAIWDILISPVPPDLHLQVRIFMWTLVQIGSWGVIIILLAELLDRLSGYGYDYEEEQES
jgi:hypothetical protein